VKATLPDPSRIRVDNATIHRTCEHDRHRSRHTILRHRPLDGHEDSAHPAAPRRASGRGLRRWDRGRAGGRVVRGRPRAGPGGAGRLPDRVGGRRRLGRVLPDRLRRLRRGGPAPPPGHGKPDGDGRGPLGRIRAHHGPAGRWSRRAPDADGHGGAPGRAGRRLRCGPPRPPAVRFRGRVRPGHPPGRRGGSTCGPVPPRRGWRGLRRAYGGDAAADAGSGTGRPGCAGHTGRRGDRGAAPRRGGRDRPGRIGG